VLDDPHDGRVRNAVYAYAMGSYQSDNATSNQQATDRRGRPGVEASSFMELTDKQRAVIDWVARHPGLEPGEDISFSEIGRRINENDRYDTTVAPPGVSWKFQKYADLVSERRLQLRADGEVVGDEGDQDTEHPTPRELLARSPWPHELPADNLDSGSLPPHDTKREFECGCGETFEGKQALYGHSSHCAEYTGTDDDEPREVGTIQPTDAEAARRGEGEITPSELYGEGRAIDALERAFGEAERIAESDDTTFATPPDFPDPDDDPAAAARELFEEASVLAAKSHALFEIVQEFDTRTRDAQSMADRAFNHAEDALDAATDARSRATAAHERLNELKLDTDGTDGTDAADGTAAEDALAAATDAHARLDELEGSLGEIHAETDMRCAATERWVEELEESLSDALNQDATAAAAGEQPPVDVTVNVTTGEVDDAPSGCDGS